MFKFVFFAFPSFSSKYLITSESLQSHVSNLKCQYLFGAQRKWPLDQLPNGKSWIFWKTKPSEGDDIKDYDNDALRDDPFHPVTFPLRKKKPMTFFCIFDARKHSVDQTNPDRNKDVSPVSHSEPSTLSPHTSGES